MLLITLKIIILTLALPIALYGAIPLASSNRQLEKSVNLIIKHINLKEVQYIHDFGCGHGKALRFLYQKIQRHNPNIKYIGYEVSIIPYVLAKIMCLRHPNIHIKLTSCLTQTISPNDIVYCYLMPNMLKKVLNTLIQKKHPITLLSNNFEIPIKNIKTKSSTTNQSHQKIQHNIKLIDLEYESQAHLKNTMYLYKIY